MLILITLAGDNLEDSLTMLPCKPQLQSFTPLPGTPNPRSKDLQNMAMHGGITPMLHVLSDLLG